MSITIETIASMDCIHTECFIRRIIQTLSSMDCIYTECFIFVEKRLLELVGITQIMDFIICTIIQTKTIRDYIDSDILYVLLL